MIGQSGIIELELYIKLVMKGCQTLGKLAWLMRMVISYCKLIRMTGLIGRPLKRQ